MEEKVSEMKDKLQPYEWYLIEQCATRQIDILSPNEAKELGRCFDIRNDCARFIKRNVVHKIASMLDGNIIEAIGEAVKGIMTYYKIILCIW